MTKMIEIDGAHGEGGGQVLRTSLALSLITGKRFHLRNVRARRSKPGLQAQHLMCVEAAAKIGHAKLRGASLQSTDLTFEPGAVKSGDYHFKIGTAGATSLVLHTIYLPLALAGASTVMIDGGTHNKAAPSFDFLKRTWAPYMASLRIGVELSLARSGFYPRGGGSIHARIAPCEHVAPFRGMTTEKLASARIVAGIAGLPQHIAERMIEQVGYRLEKQFLEFESVIEHWQGGPGCMIGIELPTTPAPTFFFALGERGKPAEMVAHEAADEVDEFLKHPPAVDEHSADQLLLPLGLAEGESAFRVAKISSHLLTNASVVRQFVDREIVIEGTLEAAGLVRVGS
jgi:RNA 3'-terminal phosphate cyclase (ATP)